MSDDIDIDDDQLEVAAKAGWRAFHEDPAFMASHPEWRLDAWETMPELDRRSWRRAVLAILKAAGC